MRKRGARRTPAGPARTAGLVAAIALVLLGPLLIAQLPYEWAATVSAHLPGSGALFLTFGEGPLDDMTSAGLVRTRLATAAPVATATV